VKAGYTRLAFTTFAEMALDTQGSLCAEYSHGAHPL